MIGWQIAINGWNSHTKFPLILQYSKYRCPGPFKEPVNLVASVCKLRYSVALILRPIKDGVWILAILRHFSSSEDFKIYSVSRRLLKN